MASGATGGVMTGGRIVYGTLTTIRQQQAGGAEFRGHFPDISGRYGRQAKRDVVKSLGEHPADAEHDHRSELGVAEHARDEFTLAGHLVLYQQ